MSKNDRKQRKKKQREKKLRRDKHVRHFGLSTPAPDALPGSGLHAVKIQESELTSVDEQSVDEQFQRIDAVLGDSTERGLDAAVEVYFEYLRKSLTLPCEVRGTEDFRWEEYYVLGPGKKAEHDRLRRHQPSYLDRYELLDLELGAISEWMIYMGDDIGAHVRRISDSKEFILGLAELYAVDKGSANYQLLNDYAVFLVNNR